MLAISREAEYAFDLIIYATGFDAITGRFNRIEIRGVDGRRPKDAWQSGPQTYLGVLVEGFPNLLIVIFKLLNGDNRYGFQLRANANALVAQGGLSLLLEAMRKGWDVNVDYDDCGGRNHEVGFGRIRVIKTA